VSGAELSRQRFLVFSPADGKGAEAHLACILDSEMAEAADALDGDQIAGVGPELRRALKTVMPAQSSGAASAAGRSSGWQRRLRRATPCIPDTRHRGKCR